MQMTLQCDCQWDQLFFNDLFRDTGCSFCGLKTVMSENDSLPPDQHRISDVAKWKKGSNLFKQQLDKYWVNQEVKFNWKADLTGIESW